ncbi:hypothetical protein ACFSM5_07905 [Lacibacterium aquatile]|uniref:Uncharacterized protein n=1 Tax=Lacibacterium aquatile TaxID=1168082 RepID=A0ABW5DQT1_9PROT
MMSGAQREGEQIALAQQDQITLVQEQLFKIETHAAILAVESQDQADDLAALERQMADLWALSGVPAPTEAEIMAAEPSVAIEVTETEVAIIQAQIPDLSASFSIPTGDGDWATFVQETHTYINTRGIDIERDPFQQLLKPHQIANVHRRFQADFGAAPWDRWDSAAVATAVLVGTLVDYFIVATPLGGDFKGQKDQRGSLVTAWLRELSEAIYDDETPKNGLEQWLHELVERAEDAAKVPYDISINSKEDGINISGLRPAMHRVMSPGHDPILGLVFGVIDILRNTCTLIDDKGVINVIERSGEATTTDPLEALVTVLLHMFSDVFTSTGLPAPFMSVLQTLNIDSGISLKEDGPSVTVTNVVRYMYAHGYDLRHFATTTLSPAIAELLIRSFHAVRGLGSDSEVDVAGIGGRMKLAKMLALSHGLLASTNIMKTALYGWNPTAFNFAQFMVFGNSLFGMLKVAQERDDLISDRLTSGWEQLMAQTAVGQTAG